MRIFFDVLIFICVFVSPWYVPLILALLMSAFFDYIEIIFVGVMIDALYGGKLFVLMTSVFFIALIYLKPRLSFYS